MSEAYWAKVADFYREWEERLKREPWLIRRAW
jgi:hypothetical protein